MNIYILNATSTGKILMEILCSKLQIRGVVTLKETAGRQFTNEYYDYYDFCKEHHLEYIAVNSYNFKYDGDKEKIGQLDIDLLLVAGWQRLLPEWLIHQCKIGVIGSHGSSEGITKGRGRSPQNWAILLGKKQFYISIFWIDAGIDSGMVIDTDKYEIDITDDILISYIKVNILVAQMIVKNLNNGKIQDHQGNMQSEEGRYLPKRIREDGKIDWNRSCMEIYNFIRALNKPYPGAYTSMNGRDYVIWEAKPINIKEGYESAKAGEVVGNVEGYLIIKCGKGLLLVKDGFQSLRIGSVFDSADYKKQIEKIIERHRESYDVPIAEVILEELT